MIRLDAEALAAVQPVPDNWEPAVQDLGNVVRWDARVPVNGQMVVLEVGLRPRTEEERTAALETLKLTAWRLTELARLGRADLLAPFRRDRHDARRRPVSRPTVQLTTGA